MKHFFVAGFDFGTSYSKVVLRDQLTGVARAVTFGPKRSGLFPSFVQVGAGALSGPDGPPGQLTLSYPKLIATDAACGQAGFSSLYGNFLHQVHRLLGTHSLKEVAAFILARYFLSVIDATHDFIGSDVDWNSFNSATDPLVVQVAVPIGLNSSDNACDKLMQRSLAAATLLHRKAQRSSPAITPQEIQAAFTQLDSMDSRSREDLDARCITYPEVAAGVQTVLRSPNTPDGKYITMDVGAGTVDINAFLRRPRNDHQTGAGLDYWACEVRPLGFARLDLPAAHHRQEHERSVSALSESELLSQLRQAISDLMQAAFRYQPNRTIGDGAPPWTQRTYAYIWGGGAEHGPYQENLFRQLKACGVNVSGVNRLPAPPDHFPIPRDVNFGRLAVAYGLSFHKANLESIRLPRELKQFDELYPSYWREVLHAEKLCPCRGNPACLRCHGLGLIRPDASLAPEYISVPQPAAVEPPRRKSRFEISLEKCVDAYERLDLRRSFLVERFLLLERIRQLCERPEIPPQSLLRQRAASILLYNVRRFRSRVRVLKHSARREGRGCECLIFRQERDHLADVLINGTAQQLEKIVNNDSRPRYTDLDCFIGRSDRREFFLEFNDVI